MKCTAKYFGLVSSIAIAATTYPVNAQIAKPATPDTPVTKDAPTVPAGQSTRLIGVRNVAPSIIAWFLQPDKQAEPLIFRQSREKTEHYFKFKRPAESSKPMSQGLLTDQLPGLKSIVPLDPQNALLVTGDEAAIKGVESIVTYLDKPMRQVEIEAQLVEIDSADMRAFGIDFASANGPFTVNRTGAAAQPTLGFVRGSFQATLKGLVEQNRAKIVSKPRLTAINNLTATLDQATEMPVGITAGVDGGFSIDKLTPQPTAPPSPLLLLDASEFTVTPTINNDDTVTLVFKIGRTWRLKERQSGDAITLSTLRPHTTVANVRDGDTIVLGGLSSQSTLGDATPAPDTKTVTLVFVTARIIRRLDEAKAQVRSVPPVTVPNQEWREAMKREAAKRGVGEKAAP